MAVTAQVPEIAFVANGDTSTFPYPFKIPLVDDLLVAWDGVERDDGFSVSGLGSGSGGNVVFAPAPTNGTVVTIQRSTRLLRQTDYQQSGDFLSPVVNADFDRAIYALQEISAESARGIHVPVGEAGITLPSGRANPNRVLGTDDDGVFGFQLRAGGVGDSSFLQSGVGAVTRTLQNKSRDTVSVKDFGARGDGIADETAAMQAAHNTGKTVQYPEGQYNFTRITFVSGGIVGAGKGRTVLYCLDESTSDVITFTGTQGSSQVPVFSDFTLQGLLEKPSGAGIRSLAPTLELSYALFRDLIISNLPTGIRLTAASQFHMRGLDVINYSIAGVHIENRNAADSGDSSITECFFNTSRLTGTTYGVWHRSSSGLRFTNNKILGANVGYCLGWKPAIGTDNGANILIASCSIEACTGPGIFLGRDEGSAGVGAVQIQNCQLGNGDGIATDTSGFMAKLAIDGCLIEVLNTTTYCIAVSNVAHLLIGSNILQTHSYGNAFGLGLTNCTNAKVATQIYVGILVGSRISNGSGNNVTFETDSLSGAQNVTTSGIYGASFTGTTQVFFPRPFTFPPRVFCRPDSSSAGATSAYATGVTAAGFTLVLIGVNNGATTLCRWDADGVL